MLDKSVPFAGFFMRRNGGAPIPDFPLPDGFRFSFFKEGDEARWARIEASVLEFYSEFAALLFFTENFLPYPRELRSRCLFVENSSGSMTGTTTAWWSDISGERRPWIHWVGVDPMYQGLGIGKAIVAQALRVMTELEGDVNFYLKTQTWSYKAIGVYRACGFEPTDEKKLYISRENNYKKAMRILRRIGKRY